MDEKYRMSRGIGTKAWRDRGGFERRMEGIEWVIGRRG